MFLSSAVRRNALTMYDAGVFPAVGEPSFGGHAALALELAFDLYEAYKSAVQEQINDQDEHFLRLVSDAEIKREADYLESLQFENDQLEEQIAEALMMGQIQLADQFIQELKGMKRHEGKKKDKVQSVKIVKQCELLRSANKWNDKNINGAKQMALVVKEKSLQQMEKHESKEIDIEQLRNEINRNVRRTRIKFSLTTKKLGAMMSKCMPTIYEEDEEIQKTMAKMNCHQGLFREIRYRLSKLRLPTYAKKASNIKEKKRREGGMKVRAE